jgi:Arc/MetJ family transcription regulator
MRTTVTLDDRLVGSAMALTCLTRMSQLCDAALKTLIERESARRLARIGGREKALSTVRRRRADR